MGYCLHDILILGMNMTPPSFPDRIDMMMIYCFRDIDSNICSWSEQIL